MRISILNFNCLSFAILLIFLPNSFADSSKKEPTRILISGSLSPQGMERIGKPINIITQEQILKTPGSTVAEILTNEPGVSASYFGPAASRPIIRGQAKERVRVLENGLEVGDASSSSDDHAVSSDPLSTERIDVLRGPSTLLYGSQAIGGVVNIIDGSIIEESLNKELTGRLQLQQGDQANDEQTGALLMRGSKDTFNWHFSAFNRDTNSIAIPGFAESSALRESEEHEHEDDHEHDHEHEDHEEEAHAEEEESRGILPNSYSQNNGIKVGVSKTLEDGFVGIAVRHSNLDYGIPGGHIHEADLEEADLEEGDHDENHGQEPGARIDMEQTRVEIRGASHIHNESVDSFRYGLSYSDYIHKELEGESVGTIFDRQAFEGRFVLTHHHTDDLEGGYGLQFNYDDFAVTGDEAFIPTATSFTPAIFAVEDFQIAENLVWQLGGRYEYHTIDPIGREGRNIDLFSASNGLILYSPEKNYSSALSLTYSQRAANTAELYADGLHVATQTYELGNQDLSRENSLGAELILRKLTGKVTGSFTSFLQHYYDYINLSNQGREIDNAPLYRYLETEARFWGFEGEAQAVVFQRGLHQITLNSGFDYVRAKDLTNNDNLPRITPMRGKVGTTYAYDRYSASLQSQFVASQDELAAFELPTDNYTLLDARLAYKLPVKANDLEFYINATNLLDEEARMHTSFLKDVAPLRGRALFFGVIGYF